MPARVVDASALAAVLFGEPEGARIAKALGKGPLFAPTLLRYEVGSVCLKKIRRYPERRADLLATLDLLTRMDLEEVEVPPVETAELAERTGLTLYDATYLWLARSIGAALVTLDERLETAARDR
jgi:predicted nucleic acid-binding protein